MADFWDILGDRDFDGDVDFTDRLIEDEELEELLADERRSRYSLDDSDDLDDELDDIDDIDLDFDLDETNIEQEDSISITISVEVGDNKDSEPPMTTKFIETDRIPSDFIQRNLEKEKSLGIDDIRFYCYWMHGFSGILVIIGELLTQHGFKNPFELRATVFDKDGDKIMKEDNFSYTGGSGFVCNGIYPPVAFDRYPFEFELHISPEKLSESILKITPAALNEPEMPQIKPIQIERSLYKDGIYITDLKPYDKFPKDRIRHIHQADTGLEELNILFLKNNEYSDDEYFANQLTFNYDYSGSVKQDLLMYILMYNTDDELVQYALKRIDEGNWDEEEESYFINVPRGECISHIDVVTTTHPLEFHHFSFF